MNYYKGIFLINTNLYNKYLNLLDPKIKNGGFALGMERIVMALTNNNKIEEMNAFNSNVFI
jgi:aspartyl/asparaginyl-tRNA synthetase